MNSIYVPPYLNPVWKTIDWVLIPFMYVLAGTFTEAPQETHRWNNVRYSSEDLTFLKDEYCVISEGDPDASRRWLGKFPLFHAPIFGGWRKYVVIDVSSGGKNRYPWYIGWQTTEVSGISLLPLWGPVRVLVGDGDVTHFGIGMKHTQTPIYKIGEGIIGEGGRFKDLPLRFR